MCETIANDITERRRTAIKINCFRVLSSRDKSALTHLNSSCNNGFKNERQKQ